MKKNHKRNLLLSSIATFCLALVCSVIPVQANASTTESADFDCTYSIPEKKPYFQYGAGEVITYTEEEAQAAGIPEGYSGKVISIKPTSSSASGSGVLLDFTAREVPITLVEGISFRFYLGESSKNTNGKPQLRISNHNGDGWVYQPGSTASVTGEWATETITRTNSSLDNLADENGNLDKFELSVRVSAHVDFFIDSVTLTLAENDGVAPEISCSEGDAITVALGSNFTLNASAYDAQEKREKTLEYIWEDGVELDDNGTPKNAGEYKLTLRSVDYFENKAEKIITVTVIEPDLEKPVISPNFTEMYAQVGMIPNLKFQVTDNQKVESVSYAWSDGALDQRGALTEGTHTYTITAKDPSNNETVLVITVFVTQDEHEYDNLIDEEQLSPRLTVTFDGANGVVCKYGELVDKPADPTREDTKEYTYVFEGWYNGETAWNFDEDIVTKDTNLVSKWTAIPLETDDDSSDSSGDSSTTPEIPDSGDDSSTTPEVPDSGDDSSTTPEVPDSGDDSSTTPEVPDSSESASEPSTDSEKPEQSSDSEEDSSVITSDSETSDESSDTDTTPSSSVDTTSDGCSGMIGVGMILPALLCTFVIYKKKSNKEE